METKKLEERMEELKWNMAGLDRIGKDEANELYKMTNELYLRAEALKKTSDSYERQGLVE